jgi:hypothetical protein
MKTLIRKELRENVKVAALGLVIYTLLSVQNYRNCVVSAHGMAQPLTDGNFLMSTTWFCGIFSAVLGWLQIYNERRPDLWAFLVHRPVTRTSIFLSKAIAGLSLYVLAAGLPLLGYIAWARLPGHVAAPFEPAMLRPAAILFLAGTVAYFAGLLTGLRQARWYGSRGLGLGVAALVLLRIGWLPAFWQSLVLLFIAEAILVAAVWAAFRSDGHYEGQPAWGKGALTGTLMVGGLVAVLAATGFLAGLLPGWEFSGRQVQYDMNKTGIVFKVTQSMDWPVPKMHLVAEPLLGAKTGIVTNREVFYHLRAQGPWFRVGADEQVVPANWMGSDSSLFKEWGRSRETVWFYWDRYGRLAGYDVLTRRFIGSLGPKGFARNIRGSGDRFNKPLERHRSRTLATATQVFRVDLEQRTTQPIFTTTEDDPILGVEEMELYSFEFDYGAVVATKRFIHLLTREGKLVWKAPYEPSYPGYDNIHLCILEPPGQFGVLIAPSLQARREAKVELPIRVIWLAKGQGVVKSVDLPGLPELVIKPPVGRRLLDSVMPPPLLAMARLAKDKILYGEVPPWLLLMSGAVAALVCLPIGWWLGRRYRFSLAAQAGWALFHLLLGVPGLLAFLSVQEWPARETCPNCKKLRVVDRTRCEHCGAGFAPPEKTGTEVFAPLAAKVEMQTVG